MTLTEEPLPVHPRTGLTAIGLLRNGDPIWPVLGASEDDAVVEDAPADDSAGTDTDTGDDQDGADTSQDGGDDDRPLGPAGTRALQAEKERRREADRARRATARERDEALAELAKLKKAAEQGKADDAEPGKDTGPDLDAIRAEAQETARAQLKAEVLKDRVSDKIEVLAAKRLQDPADAVTLLLRSNEIADFLDGDKIDAGAITEALDELLEKKPYLAAQSAKRFQGSADGGARKGPSGPSQLTEDDLKRMNPEQIVKAHEEGRFNDLLAGPH